MEPESLISKLNPIHEPDPISWWPPAPGWWLLTILLPLLTWLVYRLYKRITRNTAIKAAKKLLVQIKQDNQRDNRQKLQDLSQLLRRTALSTANRNECAGLTGAAWLTYLDRNLQGAPFSQGVGKLLAEAPYRHSQPSANEITQLVNLCENWLNAQGRRK